MKIKTIIAAFALMLSCSLSAQTQQWFSKGDVSVRAGWSISPVAMAGEFADDREQLPFGLNYIYRDYHKDIKSTGNFNLAADYTFNEWITVSLYASYAGFSRDMYSGVSGKRRSTEKGFAICAVPHFRFTYYGTELLRAYGTLGVGYIYYNGFPSSNAAVAIQFNPAGIEFGRKFFGYAEIGFGTIYMGINAGIGYRF